MLSFLIILIACTGEENWIPPGGGFSNTDSNNSESTEEENTEPATEITEDSFQLGDPLSFEASWPLERRADGDGPMREWTDATVYNEQYAVQVGLSGATLVSRENGEFISDSSITEIMYRVDSDSQLIVAGSRTREVSIWEVSNAQLQLKTTIEEDGTHEDVAINDGIVAVTWRDQGLKLYQSNGNFLTTISGEDAFTVDIFEDRLVYTDQKDLILLDISNPSSPQELDRIEMAGEGRDLAFNGDFIGVGLGGNGVATYKLNNDSIVIHDEFMFDGTALSVALDGEYLWTATWNSVWVSWLSDSGAFHLGQETPKYSAMGLDAQGGKAIIADWLNSSVIHLNAGFWGPEISLPSEIYFSDIESETIPIPISNYSSQQLIVDFSASSGVSLSIDSAVVDPGKTEYIRITTPPPPWQNISVSWSSNDPDEPSDQIRLLASNIAVGAEHPDFNLPLVTADDGIIGNARLSDYQGKVLFLAWWSDY